MHLDVKTKTIKYIAKNMRKLVQPCNWRRILSTDNEKKRKLIS